MKWALALALAASLGAQETSTSTAYTLDGTGHPIAGPQVTETRSPGSYQRIEREQSINGRIVPVERIEERVLSNDASGSVVERIVRRYDPNGQPGPPEKTVTEEHKTAAGETVRTTTYKGDINGAFQLAERSSSEVTKSGGTENSETVVERPDVNGAFEPVERTSTAKVPEGQGYEQTTTTYRPGPDGFYPAVRVTENHSKENGRVVDNSAEYEVGSSGALQLHSQTVTRTVKKPDGSEDVQVDLYGKSVPGTVNAPEAGLKLEARQITERRKTADGSIREATSVQRPSISDPGVLGPAKAISEEICRGDCR